MGAAWTRPGPNGSNRKDSFSGSSLLNILIMNKNSKVLALKYRPQVFSELIGQDVMVQTVSNSIKLNKIPNAFLLTGIRGTGKTTTARIFGNIVDAIGGERFITMAVASIDKDSKLKGDSKESKVVAK